MTATTLRRCFTIGVARGSSGRRGYVTTLTGRTDVGIVECEVGEVVGESDLAEACDIGIAAQMLGVAPAALTSGRLPHATVITTFGAQIRGDLLVTTQTLRALPLAVGEIVTVRAFGLDPGVRLRDRTRHDELLDAGRPGAGTCQQGDRQENECSRVVAYREYARRFQCAPQPILEASRDAPPRHGRCPRR